MFAVFKKESSLCCPKCGVHISIFSKMALSILNPIIVCKNCKSHLTLRKIVFFANIFFTISTAPLFYYIKLNYNFDMALLSMVVFLLLYLLFIRYGASLCVIDNNK
jgi:uncharacterized membrane protein YvbJ